MSSHHASARSLYGSPLSRPKVAKFAAIVLGTLVGLGLSNWVTFEPIASDPAGRIVFGIALLVSALFTLMPLVILWFLDRRERESPWLLAIALLWGTVIATGFAIPLNGFIIENVRIFVEASPDIQDQLGSNAAGLIAAPAAGPIVEETTKGLGLLLLFWLLRAEFDNVRDGFIYGALIGVGFNLFETAFYITNGYVETGVAPWAKELGDRYALFGFGGHALFTGLFGMGLGLAGQTMRPWLRYLAPVLGWLLAFSAHLTNNAVPLLAVLAGIPAAETAASESAAAPSIVNAWLIGSFSHFIILLPFVVGTAVILWQSGLWERQVIREELADETEPVITPAEYKAVQSDRLLRTRRVKNLDRKTSVKLVKAQNELAFRKWRVKHEGKSIATDPLVMSWREELTKLRS